MPKPEKEYQTAKELRATVTEFGLDRYEADAFKKAEASFKDGEAAYERTTPSPRRPSSRPSPATRRCWTAASRH